MVPLPLFVFLRKLKNHNTVDSLIHPPTFPTTGSSVVAPGLSGLLCLFIVFPKLIKIKQNFSADSNLYSYLL